MDKEKKVIIGVSIFIGLFIAIIVIGIIIYAIKNTSEKETYCAACEIEKKNKQPLVVDKTNDKETFLLVDPKDAKVTPQGTITAARLYTDGYIHNTSYDKIAAAIDNNSELKGDGVIGAGKGNNFNIQYQAQLEAENINNNPTSVKSQSELEQISKHMNTNIGSDSDCMLTRSGVNKGKIVLEPLGTAGVMDGYKQPERDRNHKIRMVSYAVHIPGFDIDTNNINEVCTSGGSWAKGFSPNTTVNIAIASGHNGEKSAIQPTQTEQAAETFSQQ